MKISHYAYEIHIVQVENVELSDDEDDEDPICKKFKKRKRKGKPDSLKKLNVRNPWNVDSESR